MKTRTIKVGLWRFVVITRRNRTGRQTWLGDVLDWCADPHLNLDSVCLAAAIGLAVGGWVL